MPIAALIEHGLQDTEITSKCKLFRFGEHNSLEQKTCHQFAEVTFISIPAGKLRRYRTPQAIRHNIRDCRYTLYGIMISAYSLKTYRITHVFCK